MLTSKALWHKTCLSLKRLGRSLVHYSLIFKKNLIVYTNDKTKGEIMVAQETLKKASLGQKLGLDEKRVDEIYNILGHILADVQALYIKTRGFHWNLEDPRFYFLHELFNDHYEALEEESDIIAERIRQIGRRAPGSLQEFKHLMSIKEITEPTAGDEMIEILVNDYEYIIRNMRQAIDRTTSLEDFGSADMFTQILREFEKRAWMLRSHLTP